MIPKILLRTVPEHTTIEVEDFWRIACDLHPTWEHVTWRDPLDPLTFPETSPHWHLCQNGAHLAGLVRLEALWHWGGAYLDSDVELFRPLDPLLEHHVFAGFEDDNIVPDAVLGAEAHHPAIRACLDDALERIQSDSTDWRTGNGAWSCGPGVTTTNLIGRDDVTLYPPSAFYPYSYHEKHRRNDDHRANPLTYAAHHWAGSWL